MKVGEQRTGEGVEDEIDKSLEQTCPVAILRTR
jgi:hypothetical protein